MKGKVVSNMLFALAAVGILFVGAKHIQADGAEDISVKTDAKTAKVEATVTNTAWDGKQMSVVCYEPGWDGKADWKNTNAIVYLSQTKATASTQLSFKVKGGVKEGNYTLVVGAAGKKITKTFSFNTTPEATPEATKSADVKPEATKSPETTKGDGEKAKTLAKPVVKVKAGKKSAVVSWKKVAGAKGYKVYCATKKNGKYKLVATIKKAKAGKTKVKKLKKGKKYFFVVRAYKMSGKKVVLGKKSVIKAVKVK